VTRLLQLSDCCDVCHATQRPIEWDKLRNHETKASQQSSRANSRASEGICPDVRAQAQGAAPRRI
jgi:hypothetical protein